MDRKADVVPAGFAAAVLETFPAMPLESFAGLLEVLAAREKLWARFVAAERAYWQALIKPRSANRFRARTQDDVVARLGENRDRLAEELGLR